MGGRCKSRVDTVVIATMMGHYSMDECIKYLGIKMDEMTEAMGAFAL
ncbi:MAG: hypothetical protein FWH47_00350 [Methanomassiliicoccaceae archaeon]|nr:hypothetical protein [Methanomassiliicoccaceae archaeon]